MKYERLTERDERGFPCIKGVSPENLYKGFDDMNVAVSVTWAVKRLAELEDKIERGELVEVPKGAVVLTPEEREEEMRLCNDELVGEVYCVRHGKRLEQIEEEKGE